ncbi:MAG: LicD family protein [Muribaculaceae bacterium]
MTEVEHLQKVILSIAKDIDKLCADNNIEYYLLGGSAIGAIRHSGFIPWDDDLDIIMTTENYNKFLEICQTQLDTEKYWLQRGLIDWPLNFSKIRLKGTHMNEVEGFYQDPDKNGIYVDIFKMDNVSSNSFFGYWQYCCAKFYLCYQLAQRTYTSAGIKKRIMMFLSYPMNIPSLRAFIIHQIEKENTKKTQYLGFFYGRTRWKSSVINRNIYGKPIYVNFEDTKLPVAEHYHEYLTQVFGNYMKLPPVEQRIGLHMLSIDFGKY